MTTELQDELTIRPFDETDEPAVLALLAGSLGEGPAGRRTPDFFRWKHLDNPFGRSLLLVAEMDGRVVGLRAFLRWRFRVGGGMVTAARAVDTVTDPDYQGRGIFSRLTSTALEMLAEDTDLIFNTPNASSLPGYLKLGWSKVGQMPIYVHVRRPISFARGAASARSMTKRPKRTFSVDAPRASDALKDEDLDPLLSRLWEDETRLATPVTREYLDWRYGRGPLGYHALATHGPQGLEGLAFFRVRPRGPLVEATIAEVLVPSDGVAGASALLRRIGACAPVDHLACHFPPGSPQLAAARRRVFVRAPKGELLTVRPLTDGLDHALRAPSWALTLGTLEVF